MNKKNLIQIVVIIVAFGGSGIVLYRGFFSGPKKPTSNIFVNTPGGAPGAAGSVDKILPNGNSLDLDSVLKRPNVQFDALSLPSVDPATEVGVDKAQLIQPAQKR